ncbi:MAG TPA: hypothetical protein VN457_03010, partial [Chlamydiales bacterium]|nr:hypothetical protein [Chlamydiales bacterium]
MLNRELFRIEIGSAFLCYFLLQKQKKVEWAAQAKKGEVAQQRKEILLRSKILPLKTFVFLPPKQIIKKQINMKAIPFIIATIAVCFGCNSKVESPAVKNELPSAAIQIKTALLAAPAEKRDSCTVLGYSPEKQLIVLRQGTNEMICLADNPDEPGFSVACYVKDLEPFMKRGRELRKQ